MTTKQAPVDTVKLKVELLETDKLIPSITNAKQHPVEQIAQIAASIQSFGFLDPIAIGDDNKIIEGHGRLLAAQKLELKRVPVIRLSHLSVAERKAYALAHNKLTLNSGWDLDLLKVEIESLQEDNFADLELTGFRMKEIEILFTPPSIPDTEPELDEGILGEKDSQPKQVTCPACAESFYV
jgi:ParB-like chromosome segregation protein Spo0J